MTVVGAFDHGNDLPNQHAREEIRRTIQHGCRIVLGKFVLNKALVAMTERRQPDLGLILPAPDWGNSENATTS